MLIYVSPYPTRVALSRVYPLLPFLPHQRPLSFLFAFFLESLGVTLGSISYTAFVKTGLESTLSPFNKMVTSKVI